MMTITPLAALGFLALGFALGAGYFALLIRTVRLHAEGAAAGLIAAHYIARIGAAVAVFWLVAQQGALPLLLALGGFLLARLAAGRLAPKGGK